MSSLAPFDKHPASPEAIRGQASTLGDLANKAIDQQAVTQQAFDPAATNWDGMAAPELRAAPEPVRRSAEDASSALAWAAVPLNFWANEITEFNRVVDNIVSSLASQAANDYGAEGTDGEKPTASQINSARQTAEAKARSDWQTAYNTYIVTGSADAAAMFDKGPTAENLAKARAVGAIPSSPGAFTILPAAWQHSAMVDQANHDVQLLKDAMDGKLSPEEARRVLENLRGIVNDLVGSGGNGPTSEGDLAYLATFYAGMGSQIFQVPGYVRKNDFEWDYPTTRYYVNPSTGQAIPIGPDVVHAEAPGFSAADQSWMLAALGGGMLALSNEKLGGGFNQLPQTVRDLVTQDPLDMDVNAQIGIVMTGWKLNREDDWVAMADMLGHTSGNVQGGQEFSRDLTYQMGEIASVAQSVDDGGDLGPNQRGYGAFMADGMLRDHDDMDSMMSQILGASTRNHDANADVLTNTGNPGIYDPTLAIMDYEWNDDGRTASHLYDWIGDARGSGDPSQVALADRAAAGLFANVSDAYEHHDGNFTTLGNFNRLMDGPGNDYRENSDSFGVRNPYLAQALGETTAGYLDRFGADPSGDTGLQNGKVIISEGDRIRIFTLVGTDPQAAQGLAGSVGVYEQVMGEHAARASGVDQVELANSAARVDAYLEVGLNNGALDRTHNAEVAAQQALIEKRTGFAVAKDILTAPIGLAGPGGIPVTTMINVFSDTTTNGWTAEQVQLQAQTVGAPGDYGLDNLQLNTSYGQVAALVHDGRIDVASLDPSLTERGADGQLHLRPVNEVAGANGENMSHAIGALTDAADHSGYNPATFDRQLGDTDNNVIAHDYYSDPDEYYRRILQGNIH